MQPNFGKLIYLAGGGGERYVSKYGMFEGVLEQEKLSLS